MRPLYGELAWAYELVVPTAAGPPPERIAALLAAEGIEPGSTVIDAGCGTGRHANALAAAGFAVTGFDRSAALLAEARPGAAVLVRGDLLTWQPDAPVDAVLCRGVLNDLLEDGERAGALAAFAAWLRPGGVLVADVRDWGATAGRYAAAPAPVERTGERDGRSVRFTSETSLDRARHMLLVRERYVATAGGAPIERTAVFAMRCWSAAELRERAAGAGFAAVDVRDGPDAGAARDRLVLVARR